MMWRIMQGWMTAAEICIILHITRQPNSLLCYFSQKIFVSAQLTLWRLSWYINIGEFPWTDLRSRWPYPSSKLKRKIRRCVNLLRKTSYNNNDDTNNNNNNNNNNKVLYLSVNIFSTKVLNEDTIFTSPTWDGAAILRGRPSHARV